ncbi:MAG: PAS domain-containing protein [Opitutaceae bacterium]
MQAPPESTHPTPSASGRRPVDFSREFTTVTSAPRSGADAVVSASSPVLAAIFGESAPGRQFLPSLRADQLSQALVIVWSPDLAEVEAFCRQLRDLGCTVTVHAASGAEPPAADLVSQAQLLLVVATEPSLVDQVAILKGQQDPAGPALLLLLSPDQLGKEVTYQKLGFLTLPLSASRREMRAVLELALCQRESNRQMALARETLHTFEEYIRLHHTATENSSPFFYAYTIDSATTYVSPQARAFFDLGSGQEFHHWNEFLTEHAVNTAGRQATDIAIRSGQRQPAFPLEFVTPRGRRFWAEALESPIVVHGRTVAIVGSLVDVTERRHVQDLLRLQTAALRISANSIVITDRDGIVEWANDGFSKVTGYTMAEAVGKKVGVLIGSGKHDKAFFRAFWERVLSGHVWSGEITNRRKDGTLFQEESTVTPILDEHGAVTHFIAVKQDITERKLLEAKMRQAQKMEAVGQLAGGVAHDFNNILAAVLMYLGLLQDDAALDVNTRLALKDLEREVQRGASLTRQLLTFSRQQAMEPRPLDLHEIISGLLKMLKRLLGEQVTVCLASNTGLPLIEADAGMIEQVVINLCVNARDAMPRGGPITLHTQVMEFVAPSTRFPDTQPGRYVRLTVSDQGTGMDESTLQHIFEPFFTTKEVGRGTGLGLATVYGIVRQHHGWVDVESVLGQGTSFHIYFPVTATANSRQSPAPAAPAIPRGRGEAVLVTEDEASVRKVVALSLRRHGYVVVEAENGPTALRRWREHKGKFDLLLSDMVMPEGMTGREVADLMRRESPQLKVILCTGYSQSATLDSTDPDNRVTLLRKPFDPARLLTTVRQCLDEP